MIKTRFNFFIFSKDANCEDLGASLEAAPETLALPHPARFFHEQKIIISSDEPLATSLRNTH